MKYEKIAIIGLGTLGGFVAKSISELETTKEILIADFDTVEKENLENSIYRKEDVGKFKVDCLKEIIEQSSDVDVTNVNCRFLEGETAIPNYDLIIDCRDYIYDRGNVIDVRMYISSRYLVIDCRKNTEYQKHYQGKYITELTKTDLRNAAFNASLLIYRDLISELIKRQTIFEFGLDHLDRSMSDCINLLENKDDIVYEIESNSDKLLNLDQNVHPIMNINKESDIMVYVGDKNNPIKTQLIPKSSLNSYNDVITILTSAVKILPCTFNYFVVCPTIQNGKAEIELLPETGAA